MPDNRRESDRVLPMILQRLDRQDALSDEWRAKADQNHQTMLSKLESLPVMAVTQASHGLRLDKLEVVKPMIDKHDDWIETRGKPAEKKIGELATYVSNTQSGVSGGVKGFKLGLMLGGSGVIGGAVVKAMGLIASTFGH